MAASVVRLGVVGCGNGTLRLHLPAAARLREFRITAACDTDPARLGEAADRFSIPLRFGSHRELVASAEVDAVLVATPTPSHAVIGEDAAAAGKHIVMEKPLASSLAECDRLVDAARHAGVKVLVAHNARWHRLALRARGILGSGVLGTIRAVSSVYTHAHNGPTAQPWHRKRSLGGGVLHNDGVHHFDLWRFLLDTEIVEVRGLSADNEWFEDDTCTVAARLANGALASAALSFSTRPDSYVEIFGEAGSLLLNLYRFDGLFLTPRGEVPGGIRTRLRHAVHFLESLPAGVAAAHGGGAFVATYGAMWRHFAACVLRGATPACSLADGRAAVAAALAAAGDLPLPGTSPAGDRL